MKSMLSVSISKLPTAFILAFMVANLTACGTTGSVDSDSFQNYQQAISTLKDQSDQALKAVYQEELNEFKTRVAAGEASEVGQLLLMFPADGDPYSWSYSPSGQLPIFASMDEARQTLSAMNAYLLDYAGLLITLSGADDTHGFNPQDEAAKFDRNASSLLERLSDFNVDTGRISSGELALFSVLAANIAQNYLNSKRAELLSDILKEGMPPLRVFSGKARELIAITAASAQTQYQNKAPDLIRKIIGGDGSATVDDLLALNQRISDQLSLYRSIDDGYAALPRAQQQLLDGIAQGRHTSLSELIGFIGRIEQQVEQLSN